MSKDLDTSKMIDARSLMTAPSIKLLSAVLASSLTLLAACGVQPRVPRASGMKPPAAAPVLPTSSNIPAGIYSGTLDIRVTVREDGVPTTEIESIPFTIAIDQDGRYSRRRWNSVFD